MMKKDDSYRKLAADLSRPIPSMERLSVTLDRLRRRAIKLIKAENARSMELAVQSLTHPRGTAQDLERHLDEAFGPAAPKVGDARYTCRTCSEILGRKETFALRNAWILPIYGSDHRMRVGCPACHRPVPRGPFLVRGVLDARKLGLFVAPKIGK
jgi:hypothetical protein